MPAFPRFWADTLWQDIRNQTDGGVPMVERTEDWLLDASPAWAALQKCGPAPRQPVPQAVHEMRIDRVTNGFLGPATAALQEAHLPHALADGAQLLGVLNVVIGPDMPCIVTFLAWPDHGHAASVRRTGACLSHPD